MEKSNECITLEDDTCVRLDRDVFDAHFALFRVESWRQSGMTSQCEESIQIAKRLREKKAPSSMKNTGDSE
jgi:hypothetical protein